MSEDQYWKAIGTLGNLTWVPKGRAPDLGVAERKKELLRMTRYGLELVRDFAEIRTLDRRRDRGPFSAPGRAGASKCGPGRDALMNIRSWSATGR